MERARSLLRQGREADHLVIDALLAAGLAATTLYELWTFRNCPCVSAGQFRWSAFFMFTQTLPLSLRRRYPFTVALIVSSSFAVYDALDIPPDPKTAVFALLVGLYTVSAYARRDVAIASAVVTLAALVVLNLPALAGERDFGDLVQPFAWVGGAWVVGENTRFRRRQRDLLRERAERAEREREERARLSALEERTRIAREIHDVIAHSVSVIGIQAGAARRVANEQPERAREALAAIEQVSRETMGELRRALGVLRGQQDELQLSPQPGLAALPELIGRFRQAGLAVEVGTDGRRHEVPSGLDLAAYRVIQESLTNALKHSPGSNVTVRIRYQTDGLEVTVSNLGGPGGQLVRPNKEGAALARHQGARVSRTSDGASIMSGGHGLIGMRERVAMWGGTLEAGPHDGGFMVTARFPLSPGEAP